MTETANNFVILPGGALDQRIIDQFNLRAPFKLENATLLVLALVGSHSHGTYIPSDDPNSVDDVDYMGVVIPPPSFVTGIKKWDRETVAFQFEELDCVFYSFRKFVGLLIKQNPNVVGMLWLKPDHYIFQNALWTELLENKWAFSSKAAYESFTGYAKDQLEKMESFDAVVHAEWVAANEIIEACGWDLQSVLSRSLLKMPPGECPFNAHDQRAAIESVIRIHARHFKGYMGEKRKKLAIKYGYDVKNASHLIRLMTMCNEFLMTGIMRVFRHDDANYFMSLKRGKYSLDHVKEEAQRLFHVAEHLLHNSQLPDTPDLERIDQLVQSINHKAYGWI